MEVEQQPQQRNSDQIQVKLIQGTPSKSRHRDGQFSWSRWTHGSQGVDPFPFFVDTERGSVSAPNV